MSSAIASLVKGAAQTAHAHVAALLAPTQVQPGDKLPLKETVKEADATTPITLAPSGKNIFVRTKCALALSMSPSLFAFLLLFLMRYFCVCDNDAQTDDFFRALPFLTNINITEIGWRAWSLHAYVSFAGTGIHRKARRVQGEGH